MKEMKESGVTVICLLAISDHGVPSYDEKLAKRLAGLNIPSFGATPNLLPELIEGVLKNKDLDELTKNSTKK